MIYSDSHHSPKSQRVPFSQCLFIALFGIFASACSSTDVIDEERAQPTRPDIISISLAAPQLETRADASHKLRYTARLFKGRANKAGESIEFVEKKQTVEGDSQSTLVFEGVEPGYYTLTLFADYIPADATADAEGLYPDTYYTTTDTEVVKMKKVDSGILNNDNYDCFGRYVIVTKEAEELRQTVVLPRIVSKVRLVGNAKDGAPAPESVEITRFSSLMNYNLITGTASNPYNNPTSVVTEGKWATTPSDAAANELFYFYSFSTSGYKETIGHLHFSVSASGFEPLTTEINTGIVEVRQNYVTTVKGDYIPTPAEDPGTRTDRILLDLSTIGNWAE